MTYVHPLLEQNIVDVMHVWDYARVPADKEYLRTLADPAKRVEVISPPESDRTARFPNKWKGYYKHYAVLLKADDILIKCDDDIVFMANVHVLLNEVRRDQGAHLMYYPSVVNNDVAAAFQAADGVISDPEYVIGLRTSWNESRYSRAPMSDWFNCSKCAEHVHERFLASPDTFFTGCRHEWNVACRVPINFFAMPGRNVQSFFGSYMREQYVDEPYFTALLTERTGLPSLLVSDAVVVHFSFSFQHMADERSMLERYRQLARDDALHVRLRTKFGSRALSSSCQSWRRSASAPKSSSRASASAKKGRSSVITAPERRLSHSSGLAQKEGVPGPGFTPPPCCISACSVARVSSSHQVAGLQAATTGLCAWRPVQASRCQAEWRCASA